MKRFCEECGAEQQWELDSLRGEMCCEGCGLTLDYIPNDADTNSSYSAGEERQNERVNTLENRGPGTVMNPLGDRFDAQGNRLSSENYRKFRRLGRVNRSTQREKDPMYRQLVATLRELFGEHLTLTVEFLTRATAQKLTPMQEAIRRTLSPSDKKLLACPKTSITRKPSGVKGASDRQNLVLMAIAIMVVVLVLFVVAMVIFAMFRVIVVIVIPVFRVLFRSVRMGEHNVFAERILDGAALLQQLQLRCAAGQGI